MHIPLYVMDQMDPLKCSSWHYFDLAQSFDLFIYTAYQAWLWDRGSITERECRRKALALHAAVASIFASSAERPTTSIGMKWTYCSPLDLNSIMNHHMTDTSYD